MRARAAALLAALLAAAPLATAANAVQLPQAASLAGVWRACPAAPTSTTTTTPTTAATSGPAATAASAGCFPATVPSTAFRARLEANGSRLDDVWCGGRLAEEPDVAEAGGRALYSLWWTRPLSGVLPGDAAPVGEARTFLELRGINYRARVELNGVDVTGRLMTPTPATARNGLVGAFRRWPIELTQAWDRGVQGPPGSGSPSNNTLAILVEPPDHVGNVTGAQGGSHAMARNGAVSQYTLGWDWVRGTPDRNTGVWDRVALRRTGPVALGDLHLATRAVCAAVSGPTTTTPPTAATVQPDCSGDAANDAVLAVEVELWMPAARGPGAATGPVAVSIEFRHGAGGPLVAELELRPSGGSLYPGAPLRQTLEGEVRIPNATLWWPATMGEPFLYAVNASVTVAGVVSDQRALMYGVRTVTTYLSHGPASLSGHGLPGRVFEVNGQRLFLRGGNWIATDQFLRFADDAERSWAEVRRHADLGFNLIRVWGGGLTERPEFYRAADALGVLVWQEFWMTGDNNGRWAGNATWPDDHAVYLDCVEDVIRMLRNHASLLLYVGGNELYPRSQSPPGDIARGIPALLERLDPGRLYLPSSMGNYTDFDGTYAVAPKDGPYGFLAPCQFVERNPGLHYWNGTRADNINVYLQPEIGPACSPVFRSMQRFLTPAELEAFPTERDSRIGREWAFHNYLSFTDSPLRAEKEGRDHIYSYGTPRDAADYALQAQLAQLQQFQSLFEGFQINMWRYYSGVLMWKTQSPWPSLRGFLYDSFLHPTGGYYGVRAALAGAVGLAWNLHNRTVSVINRGRTALTDAAGPAELSISAVSVIDGTTLELRSEAVSFGGGQGVGPESGAELLGAGKGAVVVQWPALAGEGDVALFRLTLRQAGRLLAANEYYQSQFRPGATRCSSSSSDGGAAAYAQQDYHRLGALRTNASGYVDVVVTVLSPVAAAPAERWHPIRATAPTARVRVALSANSSAVAFAVQLEATRAEGATAAGPCPTACACAARDARLSPVFWSHNYFHLAPGEHQDVNLELPADALSSGATVQLEVGGWNVRPQSVPIGG